PSSGTTGRDGMCFGGPSTEPRHQRKRHVVGGTGQRAESAHTAFLFVRPKYGAAGGLARGRGLLGPKGGAVGSGGPRYPRGAAVEKISRPMSERKVDNLFSCGCRRISWWEHLCGLTPSSRLFPGRCAWTDRNTA
ncbi:hypothetical protein TcCL_NonESM02765, partial [Trypanosoma cruzi]